MFELSMFNNLLEYKSDEGKHGGSQKKRLNGSGF